MKVTTATFLEQSPEDQRNLVLMAIKFSKSKVFELTKTLHKMNGWLATMEFEKADDAFIAKYKLMVSQMDENIDVLTEQILVYSQKKRHIDKLLQNKKLSDRLQTPKSV